MNLTLVTPPANYPVTIPDAKLFCRAETSEEDALIAGFLGTAVAHAESVTGRRFVSQQWRLDLPKLHSEIVLPYPDLISVDSVTYYDTDNAQQILDSSVYDVSGVGGIGNIKPSYSQSYPSVYPRDDAVQITFTCGYSEAPDGVKVGLQHIVWHLYRGEKLDNDFIRMMFGPYIVRGFCEP